MQSSYNSRVNFVLDHSSHCRFLAAGCQVARTLDLQLVDDLGFSRRYSRCMQVNIFNFFFEFETNIQLLDWFLMYASYDYCLTDCRGCQLHERFNDFLLQ